MIVRFQSNTAAGRRRMLEFGAWTADALDQVRKRGMPAALELAATLGGLTQPKTFARSLVDPLFLAAQTRSFRAGIAACAALAALVFSCSVSPILRYCT